MINSHLKPTLVVLLGFLFTACVGTRSRQVLENAAAFAHVNVIPMNREGVLEDYTVVVRGDRILKIGPAAEISIPSDAFLIDGERRFLMPGLVDMHVHLEDEEDALLLFVANGVTTVRNMWGKPKHLQWRGQIESMDRLGPTIYTTGPITDGDPPMWKGSTIVATADAAERELLVQKEAGYDGVKIMTNLLPEVYEAILAASRKHDFPVYGHVPTRVGYRQALGEAQRSFEHIFDFVYDLLLDDSPQRHRIIDAYDRKYEQMENMRPIGSDPYRAVSAERIPLLAADAAAADAWFCPTIIATEGFHIDAAALEVMRRQLYNRYGPPERLRAWETTLRFQLSEFADAEVDEAALEIDRRVVAALHRAGARVEHVSTASMPGLYDRTVPIYTFSKTYAMTGLRLGYVAIKSARIRDRAKKLLFYTASNVASVVQFGGIGVLEGSQEVIAEFRQKLKARRDLFYAQVGEASGGVFSGQPPKGAFYAFLKLDPTWQPPDRKTPESISWAMTEFLISRARIGCGPGVDFGRNGEGYVRFCFARERAELEGALDSMRRAFAGVRR